MTGRKRLMAYSIAVIAVALTVFGVVLAATDPNPAQIGKDPLALNGYPPRSASLAVTLTTSSGVGLDATVTANFKDNEASAIVGFPTIVSTPAVNVTMANDHLYARSAEVANGPWYGTDFATPSLFGVSLELTKPDIYLISGFKKSVSHEGYSTTYTFKRKHLVLTSLLAPSKSLSTLGSVRWTITVGSQGEATGSTLVITAKHSVTTISVRVLSYNRSATITVPPASDVKPLALSGLLKLLKSRDFSSLLIPRDLTSLSQTSIS